MQIQTTVRCHLTPARMAIITKSTNKCGRGCGEKGNQTEATPVGSSMEFPQKIKNGTALGPTKSTSGIKSEKT